MSGQFYDRLSDGMKEGYAHAPARPLRPRDERPRRCVAPSRALRGLPVPSARFGPNELRVELSGYAARTPRVRCGRS